MLAVTGLLLVTANVAVHRLAAKVPARMLLHELALAPHADVIALGDSTMAAGFDGAAMARSWALTDATNITVVNAALGATDPVPQLLLFRTTLERQSQAQILIYGFFDFTLTNPVPDWRSLMGNKAMVFYTQPEVAAQFLGHSVMDRFAFQVAGMVPMFVERGNIWAYVESLRRNFGGMGLPAVAVSRFGRAGDFNELLFQNGEAFRQRAAGLVAEGARLAPPVEALFRLARQHDLQVYVVAMPLPGAHRAYYRTAEWLDYLDLLRSQLETLGCRLLVANDWVRDDAKFTDALHLTPEGATEFSGRLGRELAATKKLKDTVP